MALAVAAAVGIAAVSAMAQYYNAEKARGANADELARIRAMYDQLKPPNYNLEIEAPPQMHEQALAEPEFAQALSSPKYDMRNLEPEALEIVGTYKPEMGALIEESAPELLEMSAEMREGRDAQRQALLRYREIGEDGFDPEFQQSIQMAKDRAQAESQSRESSIAQDFERRGFSGSGMELAAKIGASSQAMNQNAMMGLDAQTQAYRNRLQALSQGAQLGGQLFDQDASMQSRNDDIINNFNQRMSKRHQDYEMARADLANRAQLENLKNEQQVANQNTDNRNRSALDNRNRLDRITGDQANWQASERDRSDRLAQARYDRAAAQRQYEDSREMMQAKWRQGNVDRQNDMTDRKWRNTLDMTDRRSGLIRDKMNQNTQTARDQNQAIQGVANAGMAGVGAYQSQKRYDQDYEERRKDREAYGRKY